MIKLIAVILLGLLIGSCNDAEREVVDHNYRKVVIYDSCEYLSNITDLDFRVLTHKGNCKFCQQRNNKIYNDILLKMKDHAALEIK